MSVSTSFVAENNKSTRSRHSDYVHTHGSFQEISGKQGVIVLLSLLHIGRQSIPEFRIWANHAHLAQVNKPLSPMVERSFLRRLFALNIQ